MQKQNRVLVIPTNRLCLKAMESIVNEQLFVEENYLDVAMKYIVIDSSPRDVSKNNRKLMNKMRENLKNNNIYYFDTDKINTIYKEIVRALNIENKEEILQLLINNELSYGLAANRLSLIASLFHADYLHRRDSDVYLQKLDNRQLVKPIEIEMKYLGKKISEIDEGIYGKENYPEDETIYMVGGGYKGNWAVDFEDLARTKMEALVKLLHLVKPLLSYDDVKEIVKKRFILGSKEMYKKDNVLFTTDNYIEAGNFSLYKIFKYIPFSPAIETSGTDYLYHALLGNLRKPMLYHNRRVIHGYTPDRKGAEQTCMYHLRLAMYRCLSRYYMLLYKEILRDKNIFMKNELFNHTVIGKFLIDISKKDLKREQKEILDAMIDIYKGVNDNKYTILANNIIKNKDYIINKSSMDVYNHGILTLQWSNITKFAEENSRYLLNL
ncbi:hypothetical protein SH1V18_35130 [Vallitalea longa]|uniref:Uncharacterized protein n=1 Tax=Vallitalea longa TaxID=2936439 RepID=A0A9W5YH26_9FIRM|nr:DUF6271 family protein [Vallitalea longa]GKX31033.1 hypothetical protein SH1V18_35130 [Vallitalea longa]